MPGHVDGHKLTEWTFPEEFPSNILVPNFYIGYEAFRQIPQPTTYRAVFVTRDPRDITVSWYFSMRESHPPMGSVPQVRKKLKSIGKKKGIEISIDHLYDMGVYSSIKERDNKSEENENVKVFEFRELTEKTKNKFNEPLNFSSFDIPKKTVEEVIEEMGFENQTGREKGGVDTESHFRKGETGDWKNRFYEGIESHFEKRFAEA